MPHVERLGFAGGPAHGRRGRGGVVGPGPDRPVLGRRRTATSIHAAFDGGALAPDGVARRDPASDPGRDGVGRRPAAGLRGLPRRRALGPLLGRDELAPWESLGGELDPRRGAGGLVVVGRPDRRLGGRAGTAGSGTAGGTARRWVDWEQL